MESIKFALLSFGKSVLDKALVVHTDNYAASLIIESGSNKAHFRVWLYKYTKFVLKITST